MRWRIPDNSPLLQRFPELALFDDRADREKAWLEAMRGTGRTHILTWIVLTITFSAFGFMINLIVMPYLRPWIDVDLIPSGLAAGLGVGLSSVVVMWLRRRHIERVLREQLIERGHPVCMECGYDLRGLTEPRCPECGTAFHPMLLKPPSEAKSQRG